MKTQFILFISLFLLACNHRNCDDNCKKNTSHLTTGKTVISDTTKDLSCKLTSAELEKRKTNVLSVIKSKVLDKKELGNGYSFKFENTDAMIDMLTDFIKSERQCCDFFNFTIHVNNNGDLWFDLTGPKDAKEMISSELEM